MYETALILILAGSAVACCVMFWWCVLRPVRTFSQHEYIIADFAREFSRWEHEQKEA